MGRNHAVPAVKGLNAEEIRLLETLDEVTPPTYAQQAVGRVIGTLYHLYKDGAPREMLAAHVASSLGATGKRKAIIARGEHFVRMAAASGYVTYEGGLFVLSDAGRNLAERATAKLEAQQQAAAAREQDVAAIAADLQGQAAADPAPE